MPRPPYPSPPDPSPDPSVPAPPPPGPLPPAPPPPGPSGDDPPPSGPGRDPRTFARLLRRLLAEFNRIAHGYAQDNGLHATDVHALAAIMDARAEDGEPMTPTRLRRRLALTSGAVTACLDRLEQAGHISRVRDARDRRVIHLHYRTPAEDSAQRRHFAPLAGSTRRALERFTEEEIAVVTRFLTVLGEEVRHECRDDPPPGR
ncbi:MarR family winged helix-turn-helix transcriptional regulator [Streptomyces sp. LP05-1]|uniref:MarR family winged helix-turn-helix transcriptional regulator n=1 Tax=Streptomyces pyxinae TaxID=2970734 RepID=A0ABT2CBH3_9ACTN|nr:MarR family winged helix-turn-helix transcriptional regulator [Streptomyces sp. LP05-1]MCS0634752.1 MarR family winged helix-turn-helix transcriptional regulator [Streptomyces sp. LP05-1]